MDIPVSDCGLIHPNAACFPSEESFNADFGISSRTSSFRTLRDNVACAITSANANYEVFGYSNSNMTSTDEFDQEEADTIYQHLYGSDVHEDTEETTTAKTTFTRKICIHTTPNMYEISSSPSGLVYHNLQSNLMSIPQVPGPLNVLSVDPMINAPSDGYQEEPSSTVSTPTSPNNFPWPRYRSTTIKSRTNFPNQLHLCKKYMRKRPLTPPELEHKRNIANQQERRRMHRLNSALDKLREVLPSELREQSTKRMSKIKTLKMAIFYIDALNRLLKERNEGSRDHI